MSWFGMQLVSRRNAFGRIFAGAAGATALAVSAKAEPQPHMRAALNHLRQAKDALAKADADKGGHRANAIRLVDEAIVETERGVQFDNRHD